MEEEAAIRVDASTPGVAVVHVRGEIDMQTVPPLRECLAELSGTVVVDLSEVTFLDSSGMGVLAGQHNRLEKEGGTLRLREPQDLVRRVLEITGLDVFLEDRDS
jgi:anti-sigma B factor antagonist